MTHPLLIAGAFGSPYSMKMRGVLRYRHIPFTWVLRGSRWDVGFPPVPVALIPAIAFPNDDGSYTEAMIDSSPQIARLEALFSGERSIVPLDPVVAFIDFLIEDFGDEWLTKAMYHYRWHHRYQGAIDKASSLLPLAQDLHLTDQRLAGARRFIADRQIGRTALVGSTDANRPVIERSYARVLQLLEAHLVTHDFLCGNRPGRGDFGLYGQLSQLVHWEPDSMQLACDDAPRVMVWTDWLDDLSWLPTPADTDWFDREALPPTTLELLHEIGRTYAPFMVANAAALQSGHDVVVCSIDDAEYQQGAFPYQGKCLTWLREQYAGLTPADRRHVDSILAGTGCERLLVASSG